MTIIIVIVFALVFDPETRGHLQAVPRKYHSLIKREIEALLCFEPDVETRNRKQLETPNVLDAAWEIRFGPGNRFRVFYDVEREPQPTVYVLAVGVKKGSRLLIGGKELGL